MYELMARQCSQCLMGPNKIVSNRRKAQILRETIAKDCQFICHKSPNGRRISCAGHDERTGGGQMARLAERLDMIVLIDPDTLQPIISNGEHDARLVAKSAVE
jgi:hypothetical protein